MKPRKRKPAQIKLSPVHRFSMFKNEEKYTLEIKRTPQSPTMIFKADKNLFDWYIKQNA